MKDAYRFVSGARPVRDTMKPSKLGSSKKRSKKIERECNRCLNCGGFMNEDGQCKKCDSRKRCGKKCRTVQPATVENPVSVQCSKTQYPDSDRSENVSHVKCTPKLYSFCAKDVFFNDVNFTVITDNDIIMSEKISHCDNCLRWSTKKYKLYFKKMRVSEIICRKYLLIDRKNLKSKDKKEYYFCDECYCYISGMRYKASSWGVAWPSFIAFILVKIGFVQVWSWIPVDLRISWLPSRKFFHEALRNVSILTPTPYFEDKTYNRAKLLDALEKMEGANLSRCLDESCVADVRCFCGSQEFLEDCSLFSLQYGLVHEYSNMRKLGVLLRGDRCNRDYLAAARFDWLYSWLFLEKWRIGPCVVVDSQYGLCLLVCKEHRNGSLFRHVHLAYNPIQKNKPLLIPDRLGGLVLAPQIVKPLVKKYNVNTYEVLRMTGSYNGLSSCMLQTRRRWDITSNALADSERLQFHCRNDIRNRVEEFFKSGDISREVYESFVNDVPLSICEKEQISFCEKSATVFGIDNLLDCRKALYEGKCNRRYCVTRVVEDGDNIRRIRYNYPWPLRLLEVVAGSFPLSFNIVNKIRANSCETCSGFSHVWLLSLLLSTVSHLWGLVVDRAISDENENWEGHLLRFITVKVLKLKITPFGKDNPYKSVLGIDQLEAKIRSSFNVGSSAECNVISYLGSFPDVSQRSISSLDVPQLESLYDVNISSKILLINRTDASRISKCEIANVLRIGSKLYSLRYIGFSQRSSKFSNDGFHAESCTIPLCAVDRIIYYSSNSALSKIVEEIPVSIKQHWTVLCYELVQKQTLEEYRIGYMQSLDSTAIFYCVKHRLPLVRDIRESTCSCCILLAEGNKCDRKSHVRCISSSCHICLCKVHYLYYQDITQEVPNIISRIPVTPHSISSSGRNFDGTCESDSETDSVLVNDRDSDSGCSESSIYQLSDVDPLDLVELDRIENTDTFVNEIGIVDPEAVKYSIPRHAVFNIDSQILKRNTTRISGSLAQRRFLYSFVCTDRGRSLSLINFEADVFPSIFYIQGIDGLFPGSIPQFLYDSEMSNRYFGFDGIDTMLRTRIKDGASLTGCDPRYIGHAFDAIVNLELRGSDTRLVQSRGFEHLIGSYGNKVSESRMSFDSVDSRRRICEVASFTKKSPEFFYTHTVSMRHHPGVRLIFKEAELLGYIDSDNDLSRMRDTSIAVQLTRSAERAVRYIWEYILRSPEKPLGEVESLWYRSEWQSDGNHAGNLPHTHGLIKLKEGTQNLNDCLERIICSSSRLFNNKEYLMEIGLIESESDYEELRDRASRVQKHDCRAANYRCHRIVGENESSRCRTPHYPPSEEYRFVDYTPEHSESALELLIKIGLARRNLEGDIIWNDQLIGGKYFYPADKYEHFIPTNNHLWALHRSQCNLLYCDQYRRSRYIAKYIAASESKAAVFLKVDKSDNVIGPRGEGLQSVRAEIGPREGSKYRNAGSYKKGRETVGRLSPFTEIVYHVLKLKTLCTNVEFIKLPSVPFESRGGIYLGKSPIVVSQQSSDLSHGNQPECIRLRFNKGLPSWRLFTVSQSILYNDRATSSVSVDKYTVFSLRPPELMIISSPNDYFRWFVRSPTKVSQSKNFDNSLSNPLEFMIQVNLSESYFVDMLDHVVFIRRNCIKACVEFLENITMDIMHSIQEFIIARQLLHDIFLPLSSIIAGVSSSASSEFYHRYVKEISEPVLVNSNISPINQCKFLIHLALTLGHFETELDLFKGPSILDVFVRSKIIDNDFSTDFDEEHIFSVLRKYVLTELLYYPGGGTFTFDSYLVAAYTSLRNSLLDESYASDLPGVLLSDISQNASTELRKFIDDTKSSTIQACLAEIHLISPTEREFSEATRFNPLQWIPVADEFGVLTQTSAVEQTLALNDLITYIDSYANVTSGFSRFPVIIGSPGVGKTSLLVKLALYCIGRGLLTVFTSLTAETSLRFGGIHCHALLPIPISNQSRFIDVDRMTEKCIFSLSRNPNKTAYLKCINVICIEELGLVSAEIISLLDRVLRVIRGSTLPFGGVVVLATMDPFQLPPVEGRPLLVSPLFLTMFRMVKLSSYVRSATDPRLQRINEIGRLPNLVENPSLIDEYCSIVREGCRFESDIHNVPRTVLRVVGKRVAEQEAILTRENEMLRILPADEVYISFSVDKETISEGLNWKNATNETIYGLNRKCLSPSRLVLYRYCIMRLTENDTSNRTYSQGQLCVIESVPSCDRGSVGILLSPPGNRSLPDDNDYKAAGWLPISLSFPSTSRDVYIRKGLLGRRLQYPLKPFVAITVHRSMGCTLPSVCAKLSLIDSKDHLWLRSQLYTLFSRVERLENIILIGNITSILAVIRHLLVKPQQFDQYVHEVLKSFESIQPPTYFSSLNQNVSNVNLITSWPFHTSTLPLPDTSNIGGCVYLLCSMRNSNICYIGQTTSIVRRIQEHNRRQGSKSTRDPYLLPWICVAIITGFDAPEARLHRLRVERMWKNQRSIFDSVFHIIDSGRRLVSYYSDRALVFQQIMEP